MPGQAGHCTAHLMKLSTNAHSRVHYNVNPDGADDLFYQVDASITACTTQLPIPARYTRREAITRRPAAPA